VKQNEREWVVGLMEETLPTMIGAALEQELKPQLEQKQSEVDGGLTRLMSTTAAIQSELARLRKEMKTTNARKVKEQENLAHRIVRQWRHTHISRALQAWKEVVAQSRHLVCSQRPTQTTVVRVYDPKCASRVLLAARACGTSLAYDAPALCDGSLGALR